MISSFLELLAFGAVGFWILMSLIVVVLTALSDKDCHWFKLMLITTLITLGWPPLADNLSLIQIIGVATLYVFSGIIYSFIRWFKSVNDTVADNSDLLKKYNIKDLSHITSTIVKLNDDAREIRKFINNNPHLNDSIKENETRHDTIQNDISGLKATETRITPNNNKSVLYNWTLYWPWSILKLLTADLAESLFQLCKNQYKNVVNHALRRN